MAETSTRSGSDLPNVPIIKLFSRLNVILYRLSGGRMMGKMHGTPICLVTFMRRKSGTRTTIPLMYNLSGENVLLVASIGGAPRNPAWYFSIVANPEIEVQIGRQRRRMKARQATPDEKQKLWPAVVANFPNYQLYQSRTQRDIPVLICEPSA